MSVLLTREECREIVGQTPLCGSLDDERLAIAKAQARKVVGDIQDHTRGLIDGDLVVSGKYWQQLRKELE